MTKSHKMKKTDKIIYWTATTFIFLFEGVMPGQVVWPMRGDQGHGYDPIFQPDGFDITFGEMDRWKKNDISHRADAFRKLVQGCFT